ncbi:MAG: hypothetical protein H7837_11585 [Magnetococcus sp. MYC-9]
MWEKHAKANVVFHDTGGIFGTVPLTVIGKGFLRLNGILLPVSLCLLLFIGTMAGSSPTSSGMDGFLAVLAFIFLVPALLVLFHVLAAKLCDGLLRIVPFLKAEISWVGILFAAFCVVILGNILVDDLHQFEKGNYGISVTALCFDIAGMVAVVAAGGGKLPTT